VIPKPLNEIEWSDIEALRDSGREEDDTIEYKGSFSGGPDFLAFTDSQRVKAVEGVVREALAFLNGRGGDVVIGVREAKNDHPKIEEITPVANVVATVDRLAQSLAAVIEPTQSILVAKAVLKPDGNGEGVIVVRAPSSLRAPHRYTRDKECYVRRGRESVPMPMDEVQDVTLNRAMRRSEKNELLNRQFAGLAGGRSGVRTFPTRRFHMKVVYSPNSSSEIQLDDVVLAAFNADDPDITNEQQKTRNEVAFRSLQHWWTPELRGRRMEGWHQNEGDFVFCSKSIKQSLMMATEFADSGRVKGQNDQSVGVHAEWVIGFLANTLVSIRSVLSQRSAAADGFLRVAMFSQGNLSLIIGESHYEQAKPLANEVLFFPDYEIIGPATIDEVFRQLQIDLYSVVGLHCSNPYSLPSG
jgi:Putative DNA-binding domain